MAVNKITSIPFSGTRQKNRTSDKLIFISCEGCVTEEEYFSLVSTWFPNTKSKIHFVSVREDLISIPSSIRTQNQTDELNLSSPQQLVDKITQFKQNPAKISKYQFNEHPEDEFWIVADIDNHTEPGGNFTNWTNALNECRTKGYSYAVSNPFFELWLLLHHDEAKVEISDIDNDIQWAVTTSHSYESTNHFRNRLSNLGVGLADKKHINPSHYSKDKVLIAIMRAKEMDTAPPCDYPTNLGTTVYRLFEKIADIDAQYENN
ncbi:RloB family protein [Ruminococcus sp.]|uniref:RloB family protein n=1 Tax=Ruminococcus sp. TaxID=41978 RepID=UPI001B13E6CC|nr:RloB family protein [Ruminococcus sp.]MBO5557550.1 RloB domain-containing protein [Ruminococcus sp.]